MLPMLTNTRQALRLANTAVDTCLVASRAHCVTRVALLSRSFASTSRIAAPEAVTQGSETANEQDYRAPNLFGKNRRKRDSSLADSQEATAPRFNVSVVPPAAQTAESASEWLKDAFPALQLPDDVILQMITHESYDRGMAAGHNRRLSFMGRRIMKFSLSLFLFQSPNCPHLQSPKAVNDLLHTSKMGDFVATSLKLPQVMRWTPAVGPGQTSTKETGLFKISGICLEALLGATFHQHGAQAARALFYAKVLPLMQTFSRADAATLAKRIKEEQRWGEMYLQEMLDSRQEGISASSRELIPPFREGPRQQSLDSATNQPSRAVQHKQIGRLARTRLEQERKAKREEEERLAKLKEEKQR